MMYKVLSELSPTHTALTV